MIMLKQSYIQPTILVVKLQHSGIICASGGDALSSVGGNAGLGFGGSDSGYGGDVRTKESSSIWDDEW